ncbi:hypothetical protein NQ317_003932 [Molorchus minor]|uniref:Uncharacterized protein n=1 Tax=Molorchus minor TaxID=1323400 RepID=A0ABQ9ISP9_9CUCU|nr:hypothetical protein NQ317_003932 [Molorchus minor]
MLATLVHFHFFSVYVCDVEEWRSVLLIIVFTVTNACTFSESWCLVELSGELFSFGSMTYVVAEFDDQYGGGVALIHSTWFTPLKKEAFWPPYKEQQRFNKALRFGAVADESNWKLYSVSRIFYETDDILKARRKLKEAEVTSNLESEEDVNNNGRKEKKTQSYKKNI